MAMETPIYFRPESSNAIDCHRNPSEAGAPGPGKSQPWCNTCRPCQNPTRINWACRLLQRCVRFRALAECEKARASIATTSTSKSSPWLCTPWWQSKGSHLLVAVLECLRYFFWRLSSHLFILSSWNFLGFRRWPASHRMASCDTSARHPFIKAYSRQPAERNTRCPAENHKSSWQWHCRWPVCMKREWRGILYYHCWQHWIGWKLFTGNQGFAIKFLGLSGFNFPFTQSNEQAVNPTDQPTDQLVGLAILELTTVWEDQNVDTGRMHWHLAAGGSSICVWDGKTLKKTLLSSDWSSFWSFCLIKWPFDTICCSFLMIFLVASPYF